MLCKKNCPIATTLRAIPKSHCGFLLPPKEGEGQDEGAFVLPGLQIRLFPMVSTNHTASLNIRVMKENFSLRRPRAIIGP